MNLSLCSSIIKQHSEKKKEKQTPCVPAGQIYRHNGIKLFFFVKDGAKEKAVV